MASDEAASKTPETESVSGVSPIMALEAARLRDQPLRLWSGGEAYVAPDPRRMTHSAILEALHGGRVPGLPGTLSVRAHRDAFRAWTLHYDLPDDRSLERLTYLINKHRDVLEVDLFAIGADLAALWAARDWRRLLNLIDHLPATSWFNEAVSADEEHAQMLAEAMANRPDDGQDYRPSSRGWTQEAALLADVVNAVREVQVTLVAANGGKPKDPPRVPVPRSLLAERIVRAKAKSRDERHKALVARVLPHKKTGATS